LKLLELCYVLWGRFEHEWRSNPDLTEDQTAAKCTRPLMNSSDAVSTRTCDATSHIRKYPSLLQDLADALGTVGTVLPTPAKSRIIKAHNAASIQLLP
jgi:hypothetical protein